MPAHIPNLPSNPNPTTLDPPRFAALHGIKPLVEEMPLSKINEAFAYVASGKARYRVVLTTDC